MHLALDQPLCLPSPGQTHVGDDRSRAHCGVATFVRWERLLQGLWLEKSKAVGRGSEVLKGSVLWCIICFFPQEDLLCFTSLI